MNYEFDWKKYSDLARQAVAEGCVLLKNDNNSLPIKNGETVSVFGRIQFNYYYSGTGSGGMVNPPYVVSILDALRACKELSVNMDLLETYQRWSVENPFDKGQGWAQEPWSQKEMPLTQELVEKAAGKSDIAIVIIGRTAGEDKDNSATKGSYFLTEEEEAMLGFVCNAFSRVAVVLNVGNIIDMNWVDRFKPEAVLYAWQGGSEGGNGVCDILTGKVNPSGRLSDTIAYDINDYSSTGNFGDSARNYYKEDIYVGYRYFETVAAAAAAVAVAEKVRYPFGYGLSYTNFAYKTDHYLVMQDKISFQVTVTNTGKVAGKQVVQIYVAPPQGLLGKPVKNLIRFAKTGLLNSGESETISFEISAEEFASYDDSGVTKHKSCYVLEAGTYEIVAGFDVRNTSVVGKYIGKELQVVERLQEILAPTQLYKRIKPSVFSNGNYNMIEEEVPTRTETLSQTQRIKQENFSKSSFSDDKGYKLEDVYNKSVALPDFLAQLTDHDLICFTRGEGMCSPKVTPGTAAAFGGVTDRLKYFGIPVACCADGPSGIRMDNGEKAFGLPIGTSLACTFDVDLLENLFQMVGLELRMNKVETILGPGMNIHRSPLNGRNFEYFSEDPYLTGKMAAAELKGMHKFGVTGTIKHFAGNNQEFKRHDADSVVSERALREIYLKGFQIAVKEGGAYSIMSTYGPLNGIWTAGNYDLLTTVLRKEWKFKGIVMTDWWAKISEEGSSASIQNTAAMIKAQNDLYMVTVNSEANSNEDNSEEEFEKENICREQLIRNATNICNFLMNSTAMDRALGKEDSWTVRNQPKTFEGVVNKINAGMVMDGTVIDISEIKTEKGNTVLLALQIPQKSSYKIKFKMKSDAAEVAQLPMSVFLNGHFLDTISIRGTKGKIIEKEVAFEVWANIDNYIKLYFGESGIELVEMKICQV
jgi:beta-glucosidase